MSDNKLTLRLLKGSYCVCRLNKNAPFPEWAWNSEFYSITKTSDVLSVFCAQEEIPSTVLCEKDWRILKVEGPLDFSLVGILFSISMVLAENDISIFAMSTYDTDYIMVKEKDSEGAVKALRENHYNVIS
jgi:hypothetical protein